FVRWIGNTLFVGVIVVIITLLLAVPAGYALARLSGTFGEQLGIGIFLTYLVPPTILFIPLAKVVSTLHLQDNLWALVLTYPSFTTSGRNFTVSVGVPSFLVRGDVYFWGSLMGACFIASVPIAFLYNLFVDRFIAGFTVGAVKG